MHTIPSFELSTQSILNESGYMNYKDFVLNYFDEQLLSTVWLKNKDSVYASQYFALQTKIEQSIIESEDNAIWLAEQIDELVELYISSLLHELSS